MRHESILNSVQTWFILIVTLGLAVAPLQNGSPHQKIKAGALIWNLFVNSGLWDEDVLNACKCRPAEAWTSPKQANSHLGTKPTPTLHASVLTLRELEWSCSGVHVLHDRAYFCGGWRGVPATRLASVHHAGGYLCSGFDELQFHGSFNTFFHLLLGIHQWKKEHLAVINCSVFNPAFFFPAIWETFFFFPLC